MVGAEGVEPPTSSTSMRRSSQLSYAPVAKLNITDGRVRCNKGCRWYIIGLSADRD